MALQPHLLEGFAIGRQVVLAVVLAFPAAIGLPRFPHVQQQGTGQVAGAIHHEVEGGTLLGRLRPAPELQGLGDQGQGIQVVGKGQRLPVCPAWGGHPGGAEQVGLAARRSGFSRWGSRWSRWHERGFQGWVGQGRRLELGLLKQAEPLLPLVQLGGV